MKEPYKAWEGGKETQGGSYNVREERALEQDRQDLKLNQISLSSYLNLTSKLIYTINENSEECPKDSWRWFRSVQIRSLNEGGEKSSKPHLRH